MKILFGMALFCATFLQIVQLQAQGEGMVIDNFADENLVSKLGTRWRGVSDQVMGGVSQASLSHGVIDELR